MIILTILRWVFLRLSLGTSLVEELLPKLSFWPSLVVTLVISLYGYAHHNGELSCRQSQTVAELKQEKKVDKITKNVNNLKPSNLDKRLRPYYRD